MSQTKPSAEPCCPPFPTELWDGQTHVWEEKLFIKDAIPQVCHIPLPGSVNRVIARMWNRAQEAGAAPDLKDFLMLAYDPSPWRSEFYLAVTREVPGTENAKLSGTFVSKVFDGPFSDVPKWIGQMDSYLADRNQKAAKHYFYFTTCPRCAKIYGHNYVVAFCQV